MLVNDNYAEPLCCLLQNYNKAALRSNFSSNIEKVWNDERDEIVKSAQHELCNEGLLKYICEEGDMDSENRHPTMHFWWNEKVVALYQKNTHADWKKIILGTKRNELLSKLYYECGECKDCESCSIDRKPCKICSRQKISKIPFFWGVNIEFYYKKKKGNENCFVWTYENKIQKRNGKSYSSTGKNIFDASGISSEEELLALLEE